MKRILLRVASLIVLSSPASFASDLSDSGYRAGKPDREGIGKYYMGRQISHVMGHLGASWLERGVRQREERTDLLIANLPLEDSSVVADIGAGTGFFSFPVARRVPAGRVFAVDIQQEMLDIIERRKAKGGGSNIETVLGSTTNPNLPAETVDLAFIVDAYHEFSYPLEMSQAIFSALKPGGRLVLIEYRGEDAAVPIKRLHKMTQQQARKEMGAVGFLWEDTLDFLPQQHFMIFTKPKDMPGPHHTVRH